MAITETGLLHAEERAAEERDRGHVLNAGYDRRNACIALRLNSGIEVSVPVNLVGGLAGAAHEYLADIEIGPAGLGLPWPRLDTDLYVPALLQGIFRSRNWEAAQMGSAGGRARSPAKAAAA